MGFWVWSAGGRGGVTVAPAPSLPWASLSPLGRSQGWDRAWPGWGQPEPGTGPWKMGMAKPGREKPNPGVTKPNPAMNKPNPGLGKPRKGQTKPRNFRSQALVPSPQPLGLSAASPPRTEQRLWGCPRVPWPRCDSSWHGLGTAGTAQRGRAALAAAAAGRFEARLLFKFRFFFFFFF